MKRIFFYSTRLDIAPVFGALLETLARSFAITARTRTPLLGPIRQSRSLLPGSVFMAQALLPLWYLVGFWIIVTRTLFDRPDILLLASWPEQLFVSPFARWFKWRVIWLDLPGNASCLPDWLEGAYRWAGRGAEVIIFSNDVKARWEKRVKATQIHVVSPAGTAPVGQQSDLFNAMAERPRHRFVIGAVVADLDRELVERLLGSLSVGLSVCSTLELVIVGEGAHHKELQWLVRKLGLSSHVWLPGAAARWLDHIDVYVIPQTNPGLAEIGDAIMAMRGGVPALGPIGAGLTDVITPKTGGLVEITDADVVARQFIRLQQDEALRRQLGREARSHAETLTFERLVSDINNVFSFAL